MTFSYVSAENSWDDIESFYSVGIDITKERELQERQRTALEEAYQMARVANAAKTHFLSSMSHDIRTPMNAIMGMTAIAKANLNSPEKLGDCLDKINTSSKHLLNLINEVLDMSKIESGKVSLAMTQVNLPRMIREITDMCRPLVNEKHQQFQINMGQVRHKNVIMDGERLCQVLMNLLSNAIKYTPEGGRIAMPLEVCGEEEYEISGSEDKSRDSENADPERVIDLSGKKVLLAEDNDINREIAEELLRMHHIIVDSVENGQLAMEMFKGSPPGEYSAIVMDIQMSQRPAVWG